MHQQTFLLVMGHCKSYLIRLMKHFIHFPTLSKGSAICWAMLHHFTQWYACTHPVLFAGAQ